MTMRNEVSTNGHAVSATQATDTRLATIERRLAAMSFWLASGLGFCINHIEEAFDKLFNLEGEPIEYTEFNTDALLRSDRKDRIESLARAVQGGFLSPNEARNSEGFDDVPFGDEPRLQAQVVPLSAAAGIPSAPAAPGPQAAPAAKDYRAAVRSDVEALRSRAMVAQNERRRSTEPTKRVIRKTKLNGLQRPTLTK